MKKLRPAEFFRGIRNILREKPEIPSGLEENPVLRVLFRRRSVRSFQNRRISPEIMDAVIEAGRLAPSTVNLQSWSFGCFSRQQWKDTFGRPIPFNGEQAVMICGDVHRVRKAIEEFPRKPLVEYTLAVLNAGIAAYAMNIAAEACGVASVMLSDTGKSGFYDSSYIKEVLGLPDGVFPLTTLVLGYPKKVPLGIPPKLPKETITFSAKYREADPEVLRSWLEQMMAGYRATMITSSFIGQLERYRSKLDQAEEGLEQSIFYRGKSGADT